jgi:hypothetical protein
MLKTISVQWSFDGQHGLDEMGTYPQDAQKGRPARPQPMKVPEA